MQEALPPFGRTQGEEFVAGGHALTAEARTAVRGQILLEDAAAEVSLNGQQQEVVQAVSVAAAYYEDMLHRSPTVVLSAGSTGAEALGAMLHDAGFGVISDTTAGVDAVRVRELVTTEALGPQATTARVPASWLAGVRGALRS